MHRLQDAGRDTRASDRLSGRSGGRFAPSPTGPLHVGSLIAAVASRCEALSQGQAWSLRIDDIDPAREQAGAIDAIPSSLARYGLHWNGPVRRQSTHIARYREALAKLAASDALYRCHCTRAMLTGLPRYPGTCRSRQARTDGDITVSRTPWPAVSDALRLRLDGRAGFDDLVQGAQEASLAENPGDIVVRRRDGLVAYTLATAIDDATVETVVRGADLLDATIAQRAILGMLSIPAPRWAHVPVALDGRGEKLGKSTSARAIDTLEPLPTLQAVWRFLGQSSFVADTLDAFWREAPRRWRLADVPARRAQPAPRDCT